MKTQFVSLAKKFQKEVLDQYSLGDLSDNWDLIMGWALGKGLSVKKAREFAYYATENCFDYPSNQNTYPR